VWNKARGIADIKDNSFELMNIIQDLIDARKGINIKRIIRRLVFTVSVYSIWQERNERIFRDVKRSCEDVFNIIVDVVIKGYCGCWLDDLWMPFNRKCSHGNMPTLSRSIAEAEYCGVANNVAETCWLRNLLRELHTPLSSDTLVYCDNKKYAIEFLEKAHMVSCNPSRTPIYTESKLGDDGDPTSDLTLNRSLASSLQYLTFTRPDISYAVQHVCLHMHDPREPHLSALKRILRYVQGTLSYGLQLFSSSTTYLVAYSDADWAGCPTTRRSTSGGLPSALFEEFRSSLSVQCPPASTARKC
nr:ribonuclease H-like domain-containing protein [Tanacetum cinerariifolium]